MSGTERKNRSAGERALWAQFDALQLGTGWDEEDIGKLQILVEDAYGAATRAACICSRFRSRYAGVSMNRAAVRAGSTPRTSATAAPRGTTA